MILRPKPSAIFKWSATGWPRTGVNSVVVYGAITNKEPVMLIRIALLFTAFLSTATFASIDVLLDDEKTLILSVGSEYVLGDSDTRIDARNIALHNAKLMASESAGSYIQSHTTIVNDDISKSSVIVASSAVMKTNIKSESFKFTSDQRTKIVIVAWVEIDKESLFGKLDDITSDDSKREQVLALQDKNSQLVKQLERLNKQINTLATNPSAPHQVLNKPDQNLLNQRNKILTTLAVNESTIRKTFEKGTLLHMAVLSNRKLEKAENTLLDKYQQAQDDLDVNFLQYIKNNANVQLSDPEFKDNKDGTFDLAVSVEWYIDNFRVLPVLNKYFWGLDKQPITYSEKLASDSTSKKIPYINVERSNNNIYDQKMNFSNQLYSYLSKRSVYLHINAGGHIGAMKIAGMDARGKGYQFNTLLAMGDNTLFGQNPVVIKNVSKATLQELTTISANVEVVVE